MTIHVYTFHISFLPTHTHTLSLFGRAMASRHWGRVFLWAVLAASQETFIEQQQHVLDTIAEQIRNDGHTSCAAPQLASCGTSPCSGSSCGTYFSIAFTSAKEITSLFVLHFVWATKNILWMPSLWLFLNKNGQDEHHPHLAEILVLWPDGCPARLDFGTFVVSFFG